MYVVVDCETTGRHPGRHEILTIAAIIADERFNEIGKFHRGLCPQEWHLWDEEAESVHGISKQRAAKFKPSNEVLSDFVSFLDRHGDNYAFVCHALPMGSEVNTFDRNFIFYWFHYSEDVQRRVDYYRFFPEEKMVSTIKSKRKLATQTWDIKNQKLDTWADKLGIEFQHHNAIQDARLTLEVLKYQRMSDGWEAFEKQRASV